MTSGVFSSTLDKASKARDKQFNNFATISISTIGFPSVLTTTSRDSDDFRKRDKNNRQPENMATGVNYEMTPYATPLRPGDEDAMSQSSGMSMASTIFDGANDVRADTLRDAQDIVSGSCRKFIKKHDEAIANDDDVGATSHADGYRLECVNNAWRFVEEVRRGFCGYGAQDVQARENVAAFIKRWGVRIEKRPLLQEELRSVPGYDRDFPKEEDVKAPIVDAGTESVFTRPFIQNGAGAEINAASQKKRNLEELSFQPTPHGKRERTSSRKDNEPPIINIADIEEIAAPTGSGLPQGAIAKQRTYDWLNAHRRPRSSSPSNNERERLELEKKAAETALLGQKNEETDREIEKLRKMKE